MVGSVLYELLYLAFLFCVWRAGTISSEMAKKGRWLLPLLVFACFMWLSAQIR